MNLHALRHRNLNPARLPFRHPRVSARALGFCHVARVGEAVKSAPAGLGHLPQQLARLTVWRMPVSRRMRRFMQVWAVLAALMFFARCADQARPYLRVIFGSQQQEQHATPGAR